MLLGNSAEKLRLRCNYNVKANFSTSIGKMGLWFGFSLQIRNMGAEPEVLSDRTT